MKPKRITIGFQAEDHDLIEHLQEIREQRQINVSSYIRELIRNDMHAQSPANYSIDDLAQALAEKLGAMQIGTTEKKPTDDVTSPIGLEEKLLIDQLF